jgi:Na+-translocating ferredoxin:NAD+ oxidoreductase subunit B
MAHSGISAAALLDALPQTQCTRCGYPDCAGYAQAIAAGEADINQCPPGGAEGIERLASLTGLAVKPLNPQHGHEGPRSVAWIDEKWCIGCTLCIKACPVDAIVGMNKHMHTVLENDCTGCELCLPACPVDCIELENVTGELTGWQAWGPEQAAKARSDHEARKRRLARAEVQRTQQHVKALEEKAVNLEAHSQITDPALLDRKKDVIAQALARARARSTKP